MNAPRRAVFALSSLNLAGKFLAIGKTLIIATLFGTSGMLDAFWVAYSLPLMLPNLLTTVITVAFVPRFVKSLEGRSGVEAWRGANTLFTLAIAVAVLACVAIELGTDGLVRWLAPGLAAPYRQQAIDMIRLMLPCMLMLTVSSLLSALCNAREHFVLPGLGGVINNIAIILVALLFARTLGVRALVIGVTLGFFVQLCLLAFGNRDLLRSSLRPAFAFSHPDFLRPLGHLLPLLVGSFGATMTSLVDQYFVSHLDAGSISALTYALMMAMLPVEVFAQAVITSYYPALGRAVAADDHAAVAAAWRSGQRLILLLTLPCAVLLVGLAKPIVIVLLEHGRFDDRSTALTVEAMSLLSIGMVFRAQAYFSYRVLHSMIRPWTQVLIGLAGVATCIGLNLVWAQRWGLRGVALSAVLSQWQSAMISAFVVRRLLRSATPMPPLLSKNLLVPIGLLAAGVLFVRAFIPDAIYASNHRLWAIVCGLAAIPAIVAAFVLALRMGLPEASALMERLRARRG